MAAWMPLYWGDYFKDTLHLTLEQHGAYLLLIGAYWQRGRALPDDDSFFAAVTKSSTKKWKMVRPKVEGFFQISEGHWRHERIEKELLRSSERQKSAIANGRAGGLAKSKLPTTTLTTTIESKKKDSVVLGFGKKVGNGGLPMTPENKLSLFHNWLAPLLGDQGWVIIGKAMDPSSPDFLDCVEICKRKARANGKGWPHQWPS
jgi:uncharacterized protein YdaU (DUF1376 family)